MLNYLSGGSGDATGAFKFKNNSCRLIPNYKLLFDWIRYFRRNSISIRLWRMNNIMRILGISLRDCRCEKS